MRCADAALYEVKLDGKMAVFSTEGIGLEIRKQLGFALKDVSENLPGAFIIYKADKENDEILFANHEMIRLTDAGTWQNCRSIQKEASVT